MLIARKKRIRLAISYTFAERRYPKVYLMKIDSVIVHE